MRIAWLLALTAFAITSCADYYTLWEDDDYAVVEIDSAEPSLYRKLDTKDWIERVGSTIISVGSNEAYVVVVRDNLVIGTIEYYYIEKGLDNSYAEPKDVVSGPFSEVEFARKKRALALPDFAVAVRTEIGLARFNALTSN